LAAPSAAKELVTQGMFESPIEISADNAVLSATICAPSESGCFPCVLMLPGSGPLDRDGNIKAQRLDAFNSIARHLAANGIASLRYDKRGCGTSSGNYLKASYFDFVADAAACFDHLRNDERCSIDQIYALGHSEGTVTAMHLSLERAELAGIIQLCPLVENIDCALLKQAQHVKKAVRELHGIRGHLYRLLFLVTGDPAVSSSKMIERVRANQARPREIESKHIGLKWLREMLGLDISGLYAQMHRPMMLLAGAKDFQCDPTNVYSVRDLTAAPIEINVVENLTHTLRFDQEEPSVFRYSELLRRPIEPIVLDLILRWLRQQSSIR
jgi:hypothetical protein